MLSQKRRHSPADPNSSPSDPNDFTHAFFVCGPWQKARGEADFVAHFACCRLIGIDLSLDDPPLEWAPFDLLIERDTIRRSNPDLSFASGDPLPPTVGICLVEPYAEADTARADAAVRELVARHELACVPIDTRLDVNQSGLRTKGEVEALISRMDAVITTRLHGTVLALKHGVPVLAIDSVPGAAKVKRQCVRVGWPNVLTLDELADERLDEALAFALSAEARELARSCGESAKADVAAIGSELKRELREAGRVERNFAARQRNLEQFLASLPKPPRPPWTRRSLRAVRRSLRPIRRALRGNPA